MSGCRNRQDLTFQYPCSFRFPPLREGNRAGVRFPLPAGGTLRRGLKNYRARSVAYANAARIASADKVG